MLYWLNRLTSWLGFYVTVEHEVQRMDFQRDFMTWGTGYASRRDAEYACLISSQNMPSYGQYPVVYRVESRLVFIRYGSVKNYSGVGAREMDRIKESDRLR